MTVEPNGVETSNLNPDGSQAAATEPIEQQQAQSPTDETTKRIEYLEKEFKEVVKQRDELKRKARELEELKEKERLDALEKGGKIDELKNELSAKLAKIEAEKEELLTFKEKYLKFEQEVREELLNKLSDAKRKFVEDFPIEKLKEFVALEEAGTQKVGTGDTGRPGKGGIDVNKVSFEDFLTMTPEQKESLAQKAPAKYAEFLRIKNKKRF